MLNPDKVKKDFPIFKRKVNGKPLTYLDSASTSQKPRQVIEAVTDFYETCNSNVHRSVYKTSEEATERFESAREKVRRFFHADGYHVVFTKNCTEAINLVARGWASKNMERGDRILSGVMEHHSNIVPWQTLDGISTDFLDILHDGRLKRTEIRPGTKLVSVCHASNVLGTINDVRGMAREAHESGALVMVDGAQSAPHMRVDLKKIGCDFFAFSGHKMMGPTGTGGLLVKEGVAEDMGPLMFGSDMIKEVSLERTTFAGAPARFETGTPDIAGVIGLSAAIGYLEKIGMDNVEKHERSLSDYMVRELGQVDGLRIYGPVQQRSGVFSFNLGDAHPHDVATVLDQEGVAVRSGHHCAQPLMKRLGVSSTVRASTYVYNGQSDIGRLAESLEKARKVLKA
jgi:cysteine desulfurase/selenocysteine lyase